MHVTKLTVIFLSGFLCQSCASEPQKATPTSAAPAASRPSPTAQSPRAGSTNMQILYEKVKADKKLLVAQNMDLTEAEAAKFWPLYQQYQRELDLINQRMAGTIADYADAYKSGPVSDETAAKLLGEALAVEESEVALKKSYANKFSEVLPAAKAARYIQIETKIRSMLRLELARGIPLVS